MLAHVSKESFRQTGVAIRRHSQPLLANQGGGRRILPRTAYDAQMFPVNADINGDVNQDGMFDLGDVGPFSALLGGPASAASVPEPSAVVLVLLVLVGMAGISKPSRERKRATSRRTSPWMRCE